MQALRGFDLAVLGLAHSGHDDVARALRAGGLQVTSLDPVPLVRCATHSAGAALSQRLAEPSPSARVVLVYRNPWDSVDTAMHAGDVRVLADPDVMRRAWLAYHRAVRELARARPDTVLIAAERLLSSGATRGDDHPIAGLYQALYPQLTQLLDELDAAAHLARPDTALRARPRPAHILPGGSRSDGLGVQVVLPCRNDGSHIVEAVASVASAAGSPVELTIVDDGSEDPETRRVLGCLRTLGYDVRRTPGVGLSAARNAGLAVSSTAAVLPLDADNRVHPALLAHVRVIEADGADVVFGDEEYFGLRNGLTRPSTPSPATLLPCNPLDPCALYSRRLIDQIGGWDPAFALWEDWDFWMSAVTVGARFHRVDQVTFEYCSRPGSMLTTVGQDPATRTAHLRALLTKHQQMLGPGLVEGFVALDAWQRGLQAQLRLARAQIGMLQAGRPVSRSGLTDRDQALIGQLRDEPDRV